jgi:hypothetical protein
MSWKLELDSYDLTLLLAITLFIVIAASLMFT